MANVTSRAKVREQFLRAQTPDVALWRALTRLRSTISVMNTGAHPDDEDSGLLAALGLGRGMRIIIACSTRGEGGQNALGPERGGPLAVLRSREMELAAEVLGADVAWLGHGPEDPVHDFGFSKDGDQTFGRWGEARTVERLVRAYREDRPDIVIPTFLDVPGQHGHHRAMTRAAETAIALAADPSAYPEHFAEGLTPWQVKKFYLPAFSGGGDTYDDELPPPDATVTVRADGADPATGAAYDQIGEWSRWFHASQNMGHWSETPETEWKLHLVGGAVESDIAEGLPARLADLADGALAGLLGEADAAFAAALGVFPNREKIIEALMRAAGALAAAQAAAPAAWLAAQGHRLTRKLREIDAALIEAAGLNLQAVADDATLAQGGSTGVTLRVAAKAPPADLSLALPKGVTATRLPDADGAARFRLDARDDAPLSPLFAPRWSSLGGNGAAWAEVALRFGDHTARRAVDLVEPLTVQPATSVALEPEAIIAPLDSDEAAWTVQAALSGKPGRLALIAPEGWAVETSPEALVIRPTAPRAAGLSVFSAEIDGAPAFQAQTIDYSHSGKVAWRAPARMRFLSLDLAIPSGRIGYISGGSDRVGLWLRRAGFDVTDLTSGDLAGDLSGYEAIVVGILAFGTQPELAELAPRLHAYVEAGGNLVTLYHRPDQWDPSVAPPRYLRTGSPSVRWRVTDPQAAVTILAPDHPLLHRPNRIGPADWAGWDKERGLYFASQWDDAYQPLLAMHDPNEQPLTGALVSARIGKGRHTHLSLTLHHQMEKLTPGAFRLFANLLTPDDQP